MATTTITKRKPVFVKVDQLKPGTKGHTLIVKVVVSNPVKPAIHKNGPTRSPRIAECLIGDDTGCILFTARNDQVDIMKTGATIILRNAKIDMFKDTMRMAVDKWGLIEVTNPVSFEVNQDNNLSLVEYELVIVPDQ
ncbi:ob-fold nucleic acid binding domain-containing protein [Arabis alpina]|uniref:Ob-fold nucleic acid binding domain-containing protein n=1 Tax=Arabis alpina TaxID=50452 RepID=A0A087HKS3_ARAAL|nr:ob-fold nucleic acid binding domain-containing protein [Arabis alpina]